MFKSSEILRSFSGVSFLVLHDVFNFLVPQKMVNKALQQLLNDLEHGKFNWQMHRLWFFIMLINLCCSSQSLFWILKFFESSFKNNNNNIIY